jgi:hypothetical protein
LPEPAAAATDEAIETMAPELARLHRTGERDSSAATAMAQLLAEGVDPTDEAALTTWLDTHGDNGSGPSIPRPR